MKEITLIVKTDEEKVLQQLCEVMKKLQGDVVETSLTAADITGYTPEYVNVEKEEYHALLHYYMANRKEKMNQEVQNQRLK